MGSPRSSRAARACAREVGAARQVLEADRRGNGGGRRRHQADVGEAHRPKERDAAAVTIAILALLTLIEGMRRVPAGSVVLRRVRLGPWTVARPEPARPVRALVRW